MKERRKQIGYGATGKGKGWGGPAKGAATKPIAEIAKEYAALTPLQRAERIADKKAAAEAAFAQLVHLMDHGDTDGVRLAAADKVMDRVEGRPGQKLAIVGGDEGDRPIDTKITIEFIRPKP